MRSPHQTLSLLALAVVALSCLSLTSARPLFPPEGASGSFLSSIFTKPVEKYQRNKVYVGQAQVRLQQSLEPGETAGYVKTGLATAKHFFSVRKEAKLAAQEAKLAPQQQGRYR